jgi:hypothetical protein
MFGKLFGSNDDKLSGENIFDKRVVETEEIVGELKKIAISYGIAVEKLDFKILSYDTFYKLDESSTWEPVNDENREKLSSKEILVNPELVIKQTYQIEVYIKKANNRDLFTIKLGANKSKSKVTAVVKKQDEINYSSSLPSVLEAEINKKKAKFGFFIGIFEADLRKGIKEVIAKIKADNALKSDVRIDVCECLIPYPTVNDALIYHYKESENPENIKGKVDHSKRGFVKAVNEGDVIVEYIKPRKGTSGRSCKGAFITVDEPVSETNNTKTFELGEFVSMSDEKNSIKYIAKKSGYVIEEGNKLDIGENMQMGGLSFKTTGSIEAGTDKNVKLELKEPDPMKDAIGAGIEVEVEELDVEGNVAKSVVIKAKNVNIKGQTHGTSTIEASKASITVHKGEVHADEVEVDRLEGGKIYADSVKVKQMIGGEIIAKHIHIDILGSNATLVASDLIEIIELKGSENKFTIDPSQIKSYEKIFKESMDMINEINDEIDILSAKTKKNKSVITANKSSIDVIKKALQEDQRAKRSPNPAFLNQYKEYSHMVKEYNANVGMINEKKKMVDEMKLEIEDVEQAVYKAKIICHSIWQGHNEIRFIIKSQRSEEYYATRDGEIAKEFMLEADGFQHKIVKK